MVIEDDEMQHVLLNAVFTKLLGNDGFEVRHADRLSRALVLLRRERFDLVLLDLGLPDSHGFDSFAAVKAEAPRAPIIVLTGIDDEELGARVVANGAQDFFTKGKVTPHALGRAIRYAIERHRQVEELRNLALVDELTGLFNRRGFLVLAWHELKLAARTKRPATLLFIDVDGLKGINDSFGHRHGDAALGEVAATLTATFRESDILARVGGDEFCALLVNDEGRLDAVERLRQSFDARNRSTDVAYPLSISIGVARYDTGHPCSVEELIEQADEAMYRKKGKVRSDGAPV